MSQSESVFACDLSRMSAADKERLFQSSREIFAQPDEVNELPDGYALGFAQASPQLLAKVCDFMAYDRLCCPFIRYELVVEPYGGMTWLRLAGEPGVKEFIKSDVVDMLPPPVAAAAGLSVER